MDTRKNAPLTPKDRETMVRSAVEGGLSKVTAARQFHVTPRTVAKWVRRFRADGVEGLRDRSSRPLAYAASRRGPLVALLRPEH
jgi:transposase-like protein